MAVSEEDVREEETIEDDFRRTTEIFKRITKHYALMYADILFALCLIYVRQLKHHKHEEMQKQ